MSLCLASAGVMKALSVVAFTLVWTHSVEKVDWQEDWQVVDDGLVLVAARVKGSGAGMEPPADARLADGWYRWTPPRSPRQEVILGDSGAAGDWRFCIDGRCQTLSDIIGGAVGHGPTTMSICDAVRTASADGVAGARRPDAGELAARGDELVAENDLDAAIASFSAALALRPRSADIHSKRGEAYRAIGDWPRAVADFAAAIRLDPQHAKALDNHRAIARDLERLGALMAVSNAQSFNCRTTTEPSERAICASRPLLRLDREIHAVYSELMKAARRADRSAGAALRIQQQDFVSQRNASFGTSGFDLRKTMVKRLGELLAIDRN